MTEMSDQERDAHKKGGKKGKWRNRKTSPETQNPEQKRNGETISSASHGTSGPDSTDPGGDGDERFWCSKMQLAVMGVLSAVYVATMQRTLPGGDAGELIVAADELGVAHPPGYPLFTLMLKSAFLVIPHGSVAWKANLLTSLIAAVAGGFLYQSVFLMTGSIAAGLLAAGMFSFSRLTWMWSVTAEVFALNNLLVAVLLLAAVCFSRCDVQHKVKVSQIGAFVCGLSLSNQHTTVLYIAVIVPWVLYSLYVYQKLTLGLLMKLSLCFFVGLLPYVYLSLSSISGHARWTWGDQSTFNGFFTHLLRREYGTLELLKDHEGQGLMHGLFAYMEHVAKDLTPAILFFFATTVFSIYIRQRSGRSEMMVLMLIMLTTYTVFFAWRANLDIVKPLYRGVVERFWLQSDLILVAMAGVAFNDVVRIVNRLVPLGKFHADLWIALSLVAMHVTMNLGECDQSHNSVVEDFALTSLKAFPQGSIILTKGDLPSNSLRYYHLTEKVRPDLILFDQEVLTYDWSVPMLGKHAKGLVIPGDQMYLRSGVNSQGKKLFTFKQLLDANIDKRPIFGCIGVQDHEPSWESSYTLRPFGVCMQFLKKGSEFSELNDWLQSSRQFALSWPHPLLYAAHDDSTWEDVATGEMWRAKTAAGLYILETVDTVSNRGQKASLLQHAYQIYREAIENHPHIPGYWHKNFALVCEKLRHLTQDVSKKAKLIRTTIAHFKAYVDSGTSDPEMGAIEKAIKQLQDYVDSVDVGR